MWEILWVGAYRGFTPYGPVGHAEYSWVPLLVLTLGMVDPDRKRAQRGIDIYRRQGLA